MTMFDTFEKHLCVRIKHIAMAGLLSCSPTVLADDVKTVFLLNGQGEEFAIGNLTLAGSGPAMSANLVMDDTKYGEFFLSMRPFKCLDFPEQQLCHLPYPYENKQVVSAESLADLEYQLLFIRRQPTDYGINPWHGVYYKLAWQDEMGGAIEGQLFEVDLDILAAPPEQGNFRPITEDDLHDADPSLHIFPKLLIK